MTTRELLAILIHIAIAILMVLLIPLYLICLGAVCLWEFLWKGVVGVVLILLMPFVVVWELVKKVVRR